MNKITQLIYKKSINFPHVNVYINEYWAFSAPIDMVSQFNLFPDKELSDKDLEKLLFAAVFQVLYQKCFRLISLRPRSSYEIKLYLIKQLKKSDKYGQKYSVNKPSLINQITSKLTEKHYLNDLDFANWWIEHKSKRLLKGKKILELELLKKGINQENIKTALHQIDSLDNRQNMLKLIEKIAGKLKNKNLNKAKLKQSIYQKLYFRGFDSQEIGNQIDEFLDKE
jgi:regulatory protein